jgi:hypothetical protein
VTRSAGPTPTILEVLDDPALCGASLRGGSWASWRAFLAAVFGLPMSEEQASTFRACTGRQGLPEVPAREAWVVAGRRAGKSRVAALVAVYLACFRDWAPHLAAGEVGTVMLIAADRRQARVLMRYIAGILDGVPMLRRLVVKKTAEAIELTNKIAIEIHAAGFRGTRGYTLVGAVADELAFWRSEDSANPDTEIIAALRPAMATVPGALLLCISSPHARRGALWDAYRRHYGHEGAALVWKADSRTMNPNVPEAVIAEAYEADEAAARAEYGAEFRRDLEDYVNREVVEACVIQGRRELGPSPGRRYHAFCDPSGGSSDAMTLGIAHLEGAHVVLDLVHEATPPFNPDQVVEGFCAVLTRYGVRRITGDRYAGAWVAERFRTHGVAYVAAEKPKSALYSELLPLLNSRTIELLDARRLVTQLLALERRTAWGGRDTIDHAPGAHDDVVNAAAGALVLAAARRRAVQAVPAVLGVRVTFAESADGHERERLTRGTW